MVLDERETAGEEHLHDEQRDGWNPRHEQQKRHQNGQLAEHVLDPRQRLRQINLQRVGAAIVRDETGSDVDRDEKHEEILLVEKVAEGGGRGRQKRALWKVDRGVDLNRADDELKPGDQKEPEKDAFPQGRSDARRRDDGPGAALWRALASISTIPLIVNRHVPGARLRNVNPFEAWG